MTLAAGRGSVLCVPDARDLAVLDAALTTVLGPGRHVTLTADLGPAPRYRSFLAVARGHVQVVVGTRAAAFAPVHDLGLVAQWDDGDDLYAEPRAPYPHTREVLLLRAHDVGAGVLLAARSRSVEAGALVAVRLGARGGRRPRRGPARRPRASASPGTATSSWSATRTPARRGSRAPPTPRSARV